MPRPHTTRTIGPLHLEDLEPKRFEDLVRQLLYGFRDWSRIEATGRSGADGGFDARAWERPSPHESADEEDDQAGVATTEGRLWLVQCKREKSLPPKKLVSYFDQIGDTTLADLDAILFVVAADGVVRLTGGQGSG